jgi:hypothetical protein
MPEPAMPGVDECDKVPLRGGAVNEAWKTALAPWPGQAGDGATVGRITNLTAS